MNEYKLVRDFCVFMFLSTELCGCVRHFRLLEG